MESIYSRLKFLSQTILFTEGSISSDPIVPSRMHRFDSSTKPKMERTNERSIFVGEGARAQKKGKRIEEEEMAAPSSARTKRIRSVNKDPFATLGECLPNALRR